VPDYVFSVRSAGGDLLGNGVFAFDWTLEVDSRRGLLTLETFRDDGDTPGAAVGVFRKPMTDGELQEFYAVAGAARLGERRTAMEQHPARTESRYRFREAGRAEIGLVVNHADRGMNREIAPLRYRIYELYAAAKEHPERAVAMGLEWEGGAFAVEVRNIGKEKVCFADPRRHAVIRMAELTDESSEMLRWEERGWAGRGIRAIEEELVTMAPGAVWKARVEGGTRGAGKRYVAYCVWANYAGEAMAGGAYRIRGQVVSPRIVVDGGV
jgi:hypothetical protein